MTLKPKLVAAIEKQAARAGISASRLVENLIEEGLRPGGQKPGLWQARLGVDANQISSLCLSLGVRRLALFGSVLTDYFSAESDIDLLVEFVPDAVTTLLDRGRIQMEFEELFGRKVDLAELRLIENPIRRREILAHHVEIYAA